MVELGCKSWALLFDDIEEDMAEEDERQFKSLAGAQIALTNKVYERLKDKDIFLFCPTGEEFVQNCEWEIISMA